MALPEHNPPAPAAVSPRGDSTPSDASARLAHELSNLLDGSLRNVGLVISSLSRGEESNAAGGQAAHDDAAGDEALMKRLAAAREAMQQMAQLIHRWMRDSRSVDSLYQRSRTLGHSLAQAVALLRPMAQELGVQITAEVAAEALQLPAGPLDPVVLNAVRNSLEAIAGMASEARQGAEITLVARIVGEELVVRVLDDGPGLPAATLGSDGAFRFGVTTKATGHGLGLSLCREIVLSLGGSIELVNRSPRGVEVAVAVPVTALVNRGAGI